MDRIRNIKDLANIAGVSAGTVSRALAGSSLISLKTRERIQAIADEHGFRPNPLARNLRIRRTGAIGVVVPVHDESGRPISEPFTMAMLGLLADALTERGYDLLLIRAFPADEPWLDTLVSSGRIDGVLLIGPSPSSVAIEAVAAHYRPMVAWGEQGTGQRACTVGSDNRLGGALAARHLIERGCRRLAFVGDCRQPELAHRLEGYRDAWREAGLGGEPVVIGNRQQFADAFTAGNDRPDGVFAASDAMVASVLIGIANAGLTAPGDVKVIGHDGLSLDEQFALRLTTIDRNLPEGARHLVDLLLRRIAGEDAGSVMLEPRLQVRDST